jgi:hypothetical protein
LQPACSEGNRLQGLGVDPLAIIDDAQETALSCTIREQGQRGKTYEEWICSRVTRQSERRAQSVSLRLGKAA